MQLLINPAAPSEPRNEGVSIVLPSSLACWRLGESQDSAQSH